MSLIDSSPTYNEKNHFSFWFAFSFILNGYASGISGVSLGSVVYILMIVYTIFRGLKKGFLVSNKTVLKFGFLLTLFSVAGSLLFCLLEPQYSLSYKSSFVGFMKFWIWVLMVGVVSHEFFDSDVLLKWLIRFALIMTTYLIIQNISYYFLSIYLPNIFRFGPLQPYAEEYADYDRLSSGNILRAGSFLSESSFYGNYIICTLALYLEKNIANLKGKKLYFLLFTVLGVILSGSTSAIIIIAVIFLAYYKKLGKDKQWKVFFLLFLLIPIIILLWPVLSNSDVGISLQYSFNKFTYLDSSSRFGKSFAYLSDVPHSLLVFGVGLGNDTTLIKSITGATSVYLNSATALILQSGLVGVVIFLIFLLELMLKATSKQKLSSICLLLAYFVKGFASGIYFSTYGILFMFIIVGILERNYLNAEE